MRMCIDEAWHSQLIIRINHRICMPAFLCSTDFKYLIAGYRDIRLLDFIRNRLAIA